MKMCNNRISHNSKPHDCVHRIIQITLLVVISITMVIASSHTQDLTNSATDLNSIDWNSRAYCQCDVPPNRLMEISNANLKPEQLTAEQWVYADNLNRAPSLQNLPSAWQAIIQKHGLQGLDLGSGATTYQNGILYNGGVAAPALETLRSQQITITARSDKGFEISSKNSKISIDEMTFENIDGKPTSISLVAENDVLVPNRVRIQDSQGTVIIALAPEVQVKMSEGIEVNGRAFVEDKFGNYVIVENHFALQYGSDAQYQLEEATLLVNKRVLTIGDSTEIEGHIFTYALKEHSADIKDKMSYAARDGKVTYREMKQIILDYTLTQGKTLIIAHRPDAPTQAIEGASALGKEIAEEIAFPPFTKYEVEGGEVRAVVGLDKGFEPYLAGKVESGEGGVILRARPLGSQADVVVKHDTGTIGFIIAPDEKTLWTDVALSQGNILGFAASSAGQEDSTTITYTLKQGEIQGRVTVDVLKEKGDLQVQVRDSIEVGAERSSLDTKVWARVAASPNDRVEVTIQPTSMGGTLTYSRTATIKGFPLSAQVNVWGHPEDTKHMAEIGAGFVLESTN